MGDVADKKLIRAEFDNIFQIKISLLHIGNHLIPF